ncbi:hypothetical protein AB0L57_30065 [Nocardia sp. NPDC052254]|uniref:hypothetical protein n=1 Tax=Nocardia sp. NPDC052254 TaxID=3155681 RepID=UPI003414ECA3
MAGPTTTTESEPGLLRGATQSPVSGTVQVAPDQTMGERAEPVQPIMAHDPGTGHNGPGGSQPSGPGQQQGGPEGTDPHRIDTPANPPQVPRNPGEHPGDNPQPGQPGQQQPGAGQPNGRPGDSDRIGIPEHSPQTPRNPGETPGDGGGNKPPRSTDGPVADTHYRTVKLDPPAGASAALRSVVGMARTAIQTAVDLLGRGMPVPPPEVSDLLKPVVYGYLGQAESTEKYQRAMTAVNARQSSLLTYDHQIAQTSITVAANQDQTLAAIKEIVDELQTKLKAVPAKLTTKQEVAVMAHVGAAVNKVYKLVSAVYSDNQSHAGNGSGTSNSGGSDSSNGTGSGTAANAGAANTGAANAGAGGGGIGDIIGQLLPMAAMMVPMGAMALTPVITQMMQKNEHDKQQQELQSNGEITPGGGAAPLAADPNAAAPGAVMPGVAPAAVDPSMGAQNAGTPGATAPSTNAPSAVTPNTAQTPGSLPPIKPSPGTSKNDRTKPPTAPDTAAEPQDPEQPEAGASPA